VGEDGRGGRKERGKIGVGKERSGDRRKKRVEYVDMRGRKM